MSDYKIDNELFDRQTRTYGKDSTKQFSETIVGIVGLEQSFASEVLKNLAISGFRNFCLIDDNIVNDKDIKFGFYYNESNHELYRKNVLIKKIKELNPQSNFNHKYEDIKKSSKNILVLLNQTFNQIKNYEKDFDGKIIVGCSVGFDGFVFSNPKTFTTNNWTGENISSHNVKSLIIDDNKVIVSTITKHQLSDNDYIKFESFEINQTQNSSEYNEYFDKNQFKINVITPFKFSFELNKSIDKSFENLDFVNGSIIKVNQSTTLDHYKTFSEIIDEPVFEGFDWDNSKIVFEKYKDDSIFTKYQSVPVISVIGSLVSNEVIKFSSNNFTPINQILTFSDNVLNKLYPDGKLSEKTLEILGNKNFNMVGCGAIGCELLKNMAMIGCASKDGIVRITDPDHIEKSNLSRQFLFRHKHVGMSKAKVASMMVKEFGNINIETFENKLTPDDKEFTEKFFNNTDIILNALDNINARKYVDSIAFKNNLPLFESGTMGMKGNTQPVIPYLTETYSDTLDAPDEDSFPVCTIKNFPNMIQHTIHWARDNFEVFNRAPTNVNMYLMNKNYLNTLEGIDKATAIKDINLYGSTFKTWFDCAEYAYNQWYQDYNYNIRQLLHSFPSDKVNEDGTLFWSAGKKCPKVLEFDKNNETHLGYLESFTRILCNICGIDQDFNREMIVENLVKYDLKPFNLDENKRIASNDKELQEIKDDYDVKLISDLKFKDKYYPQEFEKDDDTNHHVMFLTCASNTRAENYGIKAEDFTTTKGIAGKIIPAVATTTSIVSGLVILEMIKYINNINDIESYNSYFVNLAINMFVPGDPIKSKTIKIGDKELNGWTKFEMNEDCTIKQFKEKWESVIDDKLDMVICGSGIIYSDFMENDINKLMSECIKENGFDPFNQLVEIIISSENYEDLPTINFQINDKLELSI